MDWEAKPFPPWVIEPALERLAPLSDKWIAYELDVESPYFTPYLVQGSDAFQLSGFQSKILFLKGQIYMYFLGIDIGKRTHVASIRNEEGKVLLKGFSFPNTTEGAES